MKILRNAFSTISILGIMYMRNESAAIEEFVETFDGNGQYASVELSDSQFLRLDNPDWYIVSDGFMRGGGFVVANDPRSTDSGESDSFIRHPQGQGSFVERVEIMNPILGPVEAVAPASSSSSISLRHHLDYRPQSTTQIAIWIYENDTNTNEWRLGIQAGNGALFDVVPSGPHVALEIRYDDANSQVTFSFDNNIDDAIPATVRGPFDYTGTVDDQQQTALRVSAFGAGANSAIIDHWSLLSFDDGTGDFNGNGTLDVEDLDRLALEIRGGSLDLTFDVNSDGVVDTFDRQYWVEELRNTYFGDANLDGEFNSLDLVTVFQAAEYEDAADGNSTWRTGDWNGDGDFSSRDLVLAFQSGGYETGPRAATHSVPEPKNVVACLFVGVFMIVRGMIWTLPGRTSKHSR
jgi:hypothetical protein